LFWAFVFKIKKLNKGTKTMTKMMKTCVIELSFPVKYSSLTFVKVVAEDMIRKGVKQDSSAEKM